jgi:hypothetical protein
MYHSDKDQEPTVYIDEIKVYCIEFWPYTTQKKNEYFCIRFKSRKMC